MTLRKNYCFVSGSRADYGILSGLMKKFNNDKYSNFFLVITGMHLLKDFGSTLKEINEDKLPISKKIYFKNYKDDRLKIISLFSKSIESFSKYFKSIKPDMIIVLGDRYEIFSAVLAASFLKIPISHFHGGEITQGAIDEGIRHSITKLSHLHFCANIFYKKNIIQMGEYKKNVHNVGSIGLDKINVKKLLNRNKLERLINFNFKHKNILITFHPVTLENISSKKIFSNILKALNQYKDIGIIFTYPNFDYDNSIISKMIKKYVKKNQNNSIVYKSLGRFNYLSVMKNVNCVVGNSSSGVIEAPFLKIPSINIGSRQSGRILSNSVINCSYSSSSIYNSIKKVLMSKKKYNYVTSKYYKKNAINKSFQIIKNSNFENLIKKKFYTL